MDPHYMTDFEATMRARFELCFCTIARKYHQGRPRCLIGLTDPVHSFALMQKSTSVKAAIAISEQWDGPINKLSIGLLLDTLKYIAEDEFRKWKDHAST